VGVFDASLLAAGAVGLYFASAGDGEQIVEEKTDFPSEAADEALAATARVPSSDPNDLQPLAPLRAVWPGRGRNTPRMRMSVTDTPNVCVVLEKPLGLVLEESSAGGGDGAVEVGSVQAGSNAERSGRVLPGDRLLRVGTADVSTAGFDAVMELLLDAPTPVELTLARATYESDALPLDITANLVKALKADEAVAVDRVVRAARSAVRASFMAGQELGRLLRVEIVIGAGVQRDGSLKVRFFAIFSTGGGGGDTYSCNVAATGVVLEADAAPPEGASVHDGVAITALSAAKDEGWGRSFDLI